MRKTTKKFLLSALIASMSFTNIYAQSMQLVYDGKTHEYTLAPITLYVNGEVVPTEIMPPIQLDNRTLVPVREVCEALGATVEYKPNEKKIYIDYEDSLMVLQTDNQEVWVDGETVMLDVPAKIINEKIMVPLRFVAETLGCEVNWFGGDVRAVYVQKLKPKPEPEVKPDPKPEVKPDPEPEVKPDPKPEVKPDPKPDPKPNPSIEDVFSGINEHYKGDKNKLTVDAFRQGFDKTTVMSVSVVENKSETTAYIQAASPITDIDVAMESGKVIIDVRNSTSGLSTTIKPQQNKYIERIRTSQFTADTTRIVFDLKSGANAHVELASNRTEIILTMTPQTIEGIAVGEDRSGEYIVLQNMSPAQVVVSDDQRNHTLTVRVPNSEIDGAIVWDDLDGNYIREIYGISEANDTMLLIQMDEYTDYNYRVEAVQGHTVIRLQEPKFKNIDYISGREQMIELTKPEGLSARDIKVYDDYRAYKITLDLGDDYSKHFGDGELVIGNEQIKSINIKTDQTTKIEINEKTIYTVDIVEQDDKIQIKLVKPKEKYNKIVVLDPGHGGNDSGTSANGIREKDINLKQSIAIAKKLEEQTDIKVYFTREADTTLTLAYRTDLSNAIDGDIFVSVHNNSVPNNTSVSGTEVLYYPDSTDTRGKRMAEITVKKIVEAVGTVNRGPKSRDNLYVLRTSNMPAILLEGGFLTNKTEADRLGSQDFTNKYAQAVVDSIVEIFDTMSFR